MRTFRIYPDNHFVYFEVIIHGTLPALRKAYGGKKCGALGYCRPTLTIYFPPKGSRMSPHFTGCIGEVHLCKKHLTMGIIAHEICHATFAYFGLRKQCKLGHGYRGKTDKGNVDEKEEAWCWINGNLNRAFWRALECFKNGTRETVFRQDVIWPIQKQDFPKSYLK